MQFVVIARDGTDPDAVARRQAVRPTHLDGIQPLVDAGHILAGGAMLDDDGNMRGSVLLVDFPSRVELDAWIDHDPYVTGRRLAADRGRAVPRRGRCLDAAGPELDPSGLTYPPLSVDT